MVKNKFCKLTRKRQTAHRNWIKDIKPHFIDSNKINPSVTREARVSDDQHWYKRFKACIKRSYKSTR